MKILYMIRFSDLNIFVLHFINILLPFAFGFCDFGKKCVSNKG